MSEPVRVEVADRDAHAGLRGARRLQRRAAQSPDSVTCRDRRLEHIARFEIGVATYERRAPRFHVARTARPRSVHQSEAVLDCEELAVIVSDTSAAGSQADRPVLPTIGTSLRRGARRDVQCNVRRCRGSARRHRRAKKPLAVNRRDPLESELCVQERRSRQFTDRTLVRRGVAGVGRRAGRMGVAIGDFDATGFRTSS